MSFQPDFLLIGAARSGTTALYKYLSQHPEIFMPTSIKEPNYFAYEGLDLQIQGPGADFINNSVTTPEAYEALFQEAKDSQIKGEASPLYLFEPRTPKRIKSLAPNAKMIAVLRNPIEQAYSHYMYATKLRVETEPDFVKVLGMEDERIAKNWQPLFGYSSFPRYGTQFKRYLEHFPREQFLIETYEDFSKSPIGVMQRMFDFIGADASFEPDISNRPNAGGVPKSQAFQDFLLKPNPVTGTIAKLIPQSLTAKIRDVLVAKNTGKKDDGMPQEAREILQTRLRDDIHALSEILDQDFTYWLK